MPAPLDNRGYRQATDRLDDIVEQLKIIVKGDPNLRVIGLADLVDASAKQMVSINTRITEIEAEQRVIRRLLVWLVVISALLLAVLVIAVFFQGRVV